MDAQMQGKHLGCYSNGLEESSNFIMGPMGLGVRWLGHVTKEHDGCDNILAGSAENRGLACPILDDATIDVASSLSLELLRHVCVPRAHARGFVEVGADFLVPRRACPAIRGFARVAFLGPQGTELHPMQQGA
jgi:hypothetical protein